MESRFSHFPARRREDANHGARHKGRDRHEWHEWRTVSRGVFSPKMPAGHTDGASFAEAKRSTLRKSRRERSKNIDSRQAQALPIIDESV
jgi:hypothetical protein